ncbi:MAG TPA: M23 family metallopeptidase [Mycobacteriales bacterium]|nr:M23 family metallopeptidase [Mycobacteriales bacterium]
MQVRLRLVRRRALVRALSATASAVLAAAVLTVPSASADIASAKERAAALRTKVAVLQRQTGMALESYSRVYGALGRVVNARVAAERAAEQAKADRDQLAGRADEQVRRLYMSGGRLTLYATLLESVDLHDAFGRYANISSIVDGERAAAAAGDAVLARAVAAEAALADLARSETRLARQADEHAARVEALLAETQSLLGAADAEVRRLVEEARIAEQAARARALLAAQLAAGATGELPSGTFTPIQGARYGCPVGPVHSFVDTWGAPRSGGRRHQGTDVFAPTGSPAYAAVNGVIDQVTPVNTGLGGISLWLRSANGDRFYYAHNTENFVTQGQQVVAGQLIATVGQTGNAATTPPHVHFEIHPGGGAAINPYPFLHAVCG